MKNLVASTICLLITGLSLNAQSIYSFEGLGSLEHQGMPNNFGMGELGIGTPSIWHVNTQNPANLVYNNFSSFQLGLELDNRRFTGEDVSGEATNGALRFLAYAFPIKPGKWSSSFGILPYSTVNYNTFSSAPVEGVAGNITQQSDDRGEGGLTSLYWAHGFRIAKKFLVGVRANYTFGSIENSSAKLIIEEIVDVDSEGNTTSTTELIGNITEFERQDSYSDLNFQFGIGYRHEFSENSYLNFGATFSPQSVLNGSSELTLLRLSNSGSELQTQEVDILDLEQELPNSYGFGVSYQRQNLLTVGLDFETQQWSDVAQGSDNFNNFSKIALGIDWIPDYDDVNSYFQRARYSFGINRTRLPYVVNNRSLTDFGINFGASLPVSGFSSIDLAFKVGRLGEAGNGLIRENYFKIVLGATINDRWFIKRRYD